MIPGSVIVARAIRLGEIGVSAVYIPEIIRHIQARYGFVKVPNTVDEILTPNAVLEFHHGKLTTLTEVIKLFRIFPRGFAVETETSTEDGDRMLDDLFEWAPKVFDVPLIPLPPHRAYISQVEFQFEDVQLARSFAKFDPVGQALQKTLQGYGQETPPFQVQSVGMSIDQTKTPLAGEFRVERRANIPHDQGIYFSQAPVSTPDHWNLLEEFERVLKEGASAR